MEVQVVVDAILWNLLQFLEIPFWMGEGVSIPLVGVGLVGVSKPMTDTQAQVSLHKLLQVSPTPLFHVVNCVRVIPWSEAIAAQLAPTSTKANLLQLLTMPGWIAPGVSIPV
jgi:hypothetical protein